MITVMLAALLTLLTNCGAKVVLHPIFDTDIVRMQKGQVLEAPQNGYFLSDKYVKSVMEAKVK